MISLIHVQKTVSFPGLLLCCGTPKWRSPGPQVFQRDAGLRHGTETGPLGLEILMPPVVGCSSIWQFLSQTKTDFLYQKAQVISRSATPNAGAVTQEMVKPPSTLLEAFWRFLAKGWLEDVYSHQSLIKNDLYIQQYIINNYINYKLDSDRDIL